MKVYICSPYSGDVKVNVERAKDYCRSAILLGYLPVAPHLYFPQFLDDSNKYERELGMTYAKKLLADCDVVWVFDRNGYVSEGMRQEIIYAKELNIPVKMCSCSGGSCE